MIREEAAITRQQANPGTEIVQIGPQSYLIGMLISSAIRNVSDRDTG